MAQASSPRPSSAGARPVGAAADAFIGAYNERDWIRLGEQLAEGCVYEQVGRPKRRVEGRAAVVEIFRGWATTAPEATGEIADRIDAESGTALEIVLYGSLKAPFGDFTPAGKPPSVRATLIFHLDDDGRVRELRNYYDSLVLYQVLGIQE
jgi:steroid delta-isomerase-like uncharacterized protein